MGLLFIGLAAVAQEPPAEGKVDGEGGPAVKFRQVMNAPSEFDDNFAHAVIAVSNEHQSIISRNYIVAGSAEKIRWLRDHPERRGNRLFRLEPKKTKLTKLPDSTNFGFIPNSTISLGVDAKLA